MLILLRFFKGVPQNGYPFSGQMCQNRCTVVNFWASRGSQPDQANQANQPETESGRAEQTLGSPRRGAG